MELTSISSTDALSLTAAELGVDLAQPDGFTILVAANLRRAASLLCPTTPTSLVNSVISVLGSIGPANTPLRPLCKDVLEQMIALGELLEFDEVENAEYEGNARLVFAAPPCYVQLSETKLLMLGIAPDASDALPPSIIPRHSGIARILDVNDRSALIDELRSSGFQQLPYAFWSKAPRSEPRDRYLGRFCSALQRASPCGELEDIQILDTSANPRWYRDRWRSPDKATGTFVAKRPRRFGANLWSLIEISAGVPQRLIDLPRGHTLERGCDQAWRLQCALDADAGHPQTFQVKQSESGKVELQIHLPPPAWLLRRWEKVGHRSTPSGFSFEFDADDVSSESLVLKEKLWMQPS